MPSSSRTDHTAEAERARILIVEDDPALARLAASLAESIGLLSMGVVDTGAAALGVAPGADIVLIDQRLEGDLSGLDVLRELRARDIPVKTVMMTAHGSEALAVEALRAGADDYLIKDSAFATMLPQVLRRVAHLRRIELALRAAQAHVVRAERRAAIAEVAVAIAHEMNNPLMALRTHLELLRMDGERLDADGRRVVADAIAQVDRISAAVRRVAEHEKEATVPYVGERRMTDLSG